MTDVWMPFLKIVPVFLLVPLGYLLKKANFVRASSSKDLTNLFMHVALPASVFVAFASLEMTSSVFFLPLAGFSVNIILMILGFFIVHLFKLHKTMKNIFMLTLPVFATATIAFPFFIALYGPVKGLSTIAFLEVGNIVFWNTFDHYLALNLCKGRVCLPLFLRRVLKNPLLWAMALGLVLPLGNVPVLFDFLNILSGASVFLIMIALGLAFKPNVSAVKKTIPIIMVKTSLGIMVAFGIGWLFRLSDFQLLSIIVYGAVPASAVTFAFAAEAHIGKYFDAELLSIALPLGAIIIPLMLLFNDFVMSWEMFLLVIPIFVLGLFLMQRWD